MSLLLPILLAYPLCAQFHIQTVDISAYSMFYTPSFADVNKLLDDFGLDSIHFSNSVAIEIRLTFGKNYFFGFVGTTPFETSRESKITLPEGDVVSRHMLYSTKHSGLTVEKRFKPFNRTNLFTGLVIGETRQMMTLSQTDGVNSWSLENATSMNNFSQTYILRNYVLQPQVNALYHIGDGGHIRLGIGYVVDFLGNTEWKASYSSQEYKLNNSPKTSLNGMTYSIGLTGRF